MEISVRPQTLLVLIALTFLLPFVGRPLFVDEAVPFRQALLEASAPARPTVSDAGGLVPPAFPWLLERAARRFGDDVWKYHLALIPFHLAALLAFYELARRYVRSPLWASVVWLASPHVWLTAVGLRPEVLVAPFLLVGLAGWVRGWERRSVPWLLLGAAGLGAASLTTRAGAIGIPLALGWTFLEGGRRRTWHWLVLALPLGMLASAFAPAAPLRGIALAVDAFRQAVAFPSAAELVRLLTFAAGTTPVLLLPLALAASGTARLPWKASLAAAAAGAVAGAVCGAPAPVAVQVGRWTTAFLVWTAAAAGRSAADFAPAGRFLAGWTVLGLAGLLFARGEVRGSSLVAVGPALVLLTARWLESGASPRWEASAGLRAGVAAALCLLSASLASADLAQARVDAGAAREARRFLEENTDRAPAYYPAALRSALGHHLDGSRWGPAEPGFAAPRGALLLLPWRGLPERLVPRPARWEPVARIARSFPLPLRTLDAVSGAGFYGAVWGPLPFSFTAAPLEIYTIVVAY